MAVIAPSKLHFLLWALFFLDEKMKFLVHCVLVHAVKAVQGTISAMFVIRFASPIFSKVCQTTYEMCGAVCEGADKVHCRFPLDAGQARHDAHSPGKAAAVRTTRMSVLQKYQVQSTC